MNLSKNSKTNTEKSQQENNTTTEKLQYKEAGKDERETIEKSRILQITKKTIRFGSDVYQFHNVTGFGVSKRKTKNRIPQILILIFAILGLIGRAYDLKLLEVIASLSAFSALYINIKRPKKYSLKLYLNSGDIKIFITKDKKFLDLVIYTLYEFMESEKEGNYIINIEDKSITIGGSVGGSITTGDVQGNISSYVGRNVSRNFIKE